MHDTTNRIRWARHPKAVAIHHGLIRIIVTHNLVQQNLTWDGLIEPLEISQNLVIKNPAILEISQQSLIPKRKGIPAQTLNPISVSSLRGYI